MVYSPSESWILRYFSRRTTASNQLHTTGLSKTLLLCLALFTGEAAAQPLAKGAIAGRVLSEAGGAPIPGAKITIKSATDFFTDENGTPQEEPVPLQGVIFEAIADANGDYRLNDIPAVEVKLVASSSGREEMTMTVTVKAGSVVRRDFILANKPTSSNPPEHDCMGSAQAPSTTIFPRLTHD